MLAAGATVACVALLGGLAGYVWARRQRRRPAHERRGPRVLRELLEHVAAPATGEAGIGRARAALLVCAVLLPFLNMFAFMAMTTWIGGDAVSGRVVDGRFYVSSHGRLTEVSERVFAISLWHMRSVELTWGLLFAGALLLAAVERFRRPKG